MKTNQLLAIALFSSIAGVAVAQVSPVDREGASSRARVHDQVLAARADGSLAPAGQVTPMPERVARSTLTREQVAAQVAEARSEGELAQPGPGTLLSDNDSAAVPMRDRAQVRQEARRAAHQLEPNPLYLGGA